MKSWFKNLKFQNKLLIVLGIIMFMVAVLSFFTVTTINNIEKSYVKLIEGPQQRLTYASDAVRELTNIRRYILSMGYAAEDIEEVRLNFRKYMDSAELFNQCMNNYYDNLMSDAFFTEDLKSSRVEAVLDINSIFINSYMPYVNALYQASKQKDRAAVDELVQIGIPMGDKITSELGHLRLLVQENLNVIRIETHNYTNNAKNTVVVFSMSIIVLALIVTLIMSYVIKEPIVNMEAAMEEIAKGNLTYPIRNGYKDELGILSNSIGNMVDTISVLNKAVTIMDNLDDMIFVTDFDNNIIYANKKILDVCCVENEDCINKKCYDILYDLESPCPYCPLPLLIKDKENLPSYEWEKYVEDKKMWLNCITSVIRWVDGSLVLINTCKDITLKKLRDDERIRHEYELSKAVEAAKEASRMKSVFLANMSHEIRTPMNSIIGFSELALGDNIHPKTRDYLSKIKSSSEGLLQILNDILDISKIEAGKIILENIPFNVHEIFRVCQTITAPRALKKGIMLFCYAEPSIGKKLLGDPTRLRQILLNLLSNAVKFTNVGIVKLLSSVQEYDDENVTLHFEIKDSGIGMTPAQIKRIFDPFTQADETTTRKYGGTGLGLSITKNMIQLMGGKLLVESTLGVGSKFSFDLTFKTVDVESDPNNYEPETVIFEKPIFKGDVLVCEDNVMNQQVIADHLSRVGLSVVMAENGKEAIMHVQRRINSSKPPFDLIFMDINMPLMDGLEAAKHLESMKNVSPIIALTANIMTYDKEIYRQVGIPDCLAKPFTTQSLWRCLLKYITPIEIKAADKNELSTADTKLNHQLLVNFWKDNQTALEDLKDALYTNDVKRAHRKSHTLKTLAGLIGKVALKEAALAIETALSQGKCEITSRQLEKLEFEFKKVMKELDFMFAENKITDENTNKKNTATFNISNALEIIKKLEPLLETSDSDCLDLVDEITIIPDSEDLIEYIEHFNFAPARIILEKIKRKLEDEINV